MRPTAALGERTRSPACLLTGPPDLSPWEACGFVSVGVRKAAGTDRGNLMALALRFKR